MTMRMMMMKMMIAKSSNPYPLPSRTKSRHTNQNLSKSMVAQTHRRTEDNKARKHTSCIVHLADSANFKGVTSNKLCNGLIVSCFESPNDTIHVTEKSPQ